MVTNRELIDAALESLHPLRRDDGVKFGNVSAAVASSNERIYRGVNLFTPAGAAQICAEKMAFGAMATAGEYVAAKVVAVWRPRGGDDAHVVPPCGWCREFISQLAPTGHETMVVLGEQECVPVSQLLPRNLWPGPLVSAGR
ncbi:putative deaminase [Microlunatus phosphovorus NM-1]|uniref:Putative deaminase n=1 Tax=Microlunatus phosphovorus (strain ATCC 700054 / DSM 10555 / JCM 9379 / NBRC 101784 / NCIMB 13414 / VKM Ac-1990 / NM-1) TaxID=1032480 RepID=F5XR14_MICPN|nr:cytidine deaminase [Microlunatus phosphovorus]BAK37036.1 putative deaminase [Microlunatus phosphovorus NM-1]